MHGAQVIMVRGNFDSCLALARQLAWEYPVELVNSVNPVRLQGQKTASFEIVDFLGDAPDLHLLPVGNAGNIAAYWLGYSQYFDLGLASKTPKMRGFQAEGAAPLVTGEPFPDPETKATAIRVGNPASWKLAEAAADESDGRFDLRHRRPDPRRPARAGLPRRRLRRARVGGRHRRTAAGHRRRRVLRRPDHRRHGDRSRAQGHRDRARGHGTDRRHRRRRGRHRRPPRQPGSPDRGHLRRRVRSGCRCRPPRPTSAPASTRSGWRSTCATGSRRRSCPRGSSSRSTVRVPTRCRSTRPTSSCARCAPRSSRWTPPRPACGSPAPTSSRTRAASARRRPRSSAGSAWPGRWSPADRCCSTTTPSSRWRPGSRVTPTTWRPRSTAAS